jgi:hypothetical protein
MKDFIVRSKFYAPGFVPGIPWAGISITTYKDEWPTLNATQRMGLLQLAFADLEFPKSGYEHMLFNHEEADKILDFVADMYDKVEVFLVHCEAGVSRSPAVAAALTKIYGGDDSFYFDNYCPNMLVYNRLLKRAEERKNAEFVSELSDNG